MWLVLFLAAAFIWSPINAGSVKVCKDIVDCKTCAESYIHILGFKEDCRWCVETKSCGGPLSCPMGKPAIQRDSFKCPTPINKATGKRYTDALGRSLYAVAISVRDINVTNCLHSLRPDITYSRTYEEVCDAAGNTCKGILGVSKEAKAIYVAYKGSTVAKQIFAEMLHGITAQLGAWEKFESDEAGVITYFHNAFYKLFVDSGMKDDLIDLREKYPNYRVWVTGHSLGGSLASMTALHLVKNKIADNKIVRLVTFGEPRTGNIAYAKEVEKHISFRYRVVKKNDPVPNMPASLNSGPMLTATMYNRQPLHYRYLIHYDNSMSKGSKYRSCEVSDDLGCRNTALSDITDHVSYFQVDNDDFIKRGCPRREILP